MPETTGRPQRCAGHAIRRFGLESRRNPRNGSHTLTPLETWSLCALIVIWTTMLGLLPALINIGELDPQNVFDQTTRFTRWLWSWPRLKWIILLSGVLGAAFSLDHFVV